MSKYIIELDENAKEVVVISLEDGDMWTEPMEVEDLEQLNSDYINEHYGQLQQDAYDKGYKDGRNVTETQAHNDAYQRGLEDGKWKSEDGCTGCKYEGKTGEHLPCDYCMNNFKNQWTSKSDKIEVGDEVKHKSDRVAWTAIVTRICCGTLTLMEHNGASADNYPIEEFVKTGRHFDIASILEAMKHD